MVYLRDNKLLHMGDQVNGPCPVMADADQHKLTEIHTAALALIDNGAVTHLTDGHTFTIDDAATAVTRLRQLLDHSLALQTSAADLTDAQAHIRGADFAARLTRWYDELGVHGANPNPVFLGMMAAAHLQRLGYTRNGLSTEWHAPHLTARTSPVRTAGRVLRRAAATVPWIVRGLRRNPKPQPRPSASTAFHPSRRRRHRPARSA